MRTVIDRTARVLGGLALLAGILLALSAPAQAQTITADPQTVIVAKDSAQGATTITWDAGAGIKNLGATLWQQIDGGKETLVAAKAKGSQTILIGAGETRVFKLHNFINSKVLASVTVTASGAGAAPDQNVPNAGAPVAGAPAANDAPADDAAAGEATAVSFTGTWETIAGEIEDTVILKQIGKNVTGSYSPGNGKIFEGVVTGNKLTFKWTQDGGKEGTAEFTMDEDGKGFTGSSSALKPTEYTFRWSTHKAPAASFAGTWKTIAGGTHQYAVILKQIGKNVTGSYSPGNGKIFDGVVSGNKLTFKWTQDGGYEGTGEFNMDEDGKGFTGSSTALKPQEFTNTWNTYEPEAASFAGNWETISDGQYSIPLTIVQTGNKVTGLYPGNNGKIEGTVTGKVLRFKWESDGGSGSGRFVMDESNWAFSGTYNRGDNPDEVEATWNGTHAPYTGGKGPPVSFAGVWTGLAGSTAATMDTLTWKLKQTGDQVTGQVQSSYKAFGIVIIREGIVSGNTLRFHLDYRNGSGVTAEFVMDKGGKSFHGKLGVGTATATFVGP